MGDLIIANENDCMKLVNGNYWSTVIVDAHACLLSNNITLADNPYLDRLLFYEHSLPNVNQLTISNNPHLDSILIEDYSFENTHSIILNSKPLVFSLLLIYLFYDPFILVIIHLLMHLFSSYQVQYTHISL